MKARQRRLRESRKSKDRSREGAFYIFVVSERPYCRWSLGNHIQVLRALQNGVRHQKWGRQSLDRNGEDGMDGFTALMHFKSGKSLEEFAWGGTAPPLSLLPTFVQ